MNLRRILQGITLFVLLTFSVNEASAQQSQLAGINADGLIQLGANHPFVVTNYVLDISPLNVQSAGAVLDVLRIYQNEGFVDFTIDMVKNEATMKIDASKIADVQLTVAQMNEKFRMIQNLNR